jgi:hypothetical protein
MGLLDDAIREHLELKRRRGADPGEVAREQREVLDPVVSGESSPSDVGDGSPDGAIAIGAGQLPDGTIPGVHPSDGPTADDARERNFSSVGQETAELDMQAVLDEDDSASEAVASAQDAPLVVQDSLEWEVPAGTEKQAGTDRHDEAIGRHGHHGDSDDLRDERDSLQSRDAGSDVHVEIPGQERLSFE